MYCFVCVRCGKEVLTEDKVGRCPHCGREHKIIWPDDRRSRPNGPRTITEVYEEGK